MELLDRYLQAVKKYLPTRRQDDIIAELRANMESQIEDKESELGRPLTQGEMEDLLRKMGSPLKVASRYQSQQYLIGPTFFPMYVYVHAPSAVVGLHHHRDRDCSCYSAHNTRRGRSLRSRCSASPASSSRLRAGSRSFSR